MKIYVCTPYRADTPEGVEKNARFARNCCRFVCDEGHVPVAPHLYYPRFLDDNDPEERAWGLARGLGDLKGCHELWVFGDRVSDGMAGEIVLAMDLGLPVLRFTDEEVEGKRG